MKFTLSAILLLAVGTLTEAHNVRTGTEQNEVFDTSKSVERTTPRSSISYHFTGSSKHACRLDESNLGGPNDPLASGNDNKYFKIAPNTWSQADCESKCKADGGCFAIEYGSNNNRCELWKVRPKWMKPSSGYSCLVMSGTTSKSAERTTGTTKHHEVKHERSHHQSPIPKTSTSCSSASDCVDSAAGELCIMDYSTDTTYCRGKGGIGEACGGDGDCISDACLDYNYPHVECAECYMNEHCDGHEDGPRCIQNGPNLPVCGPLVQTGEHCNYYDDECASNVCFDFTCTECRVNEDCDGHADGPRCIINWTEADLPVCGPLGQPGEHCEYHDEECASNVCLDHVCE